MKRKNRSKSDRLDNLLDENIINGDMFEDEFSDGEPDDELDVELSEDESDNMTDEELPEDESDDMADEELPEDESDDMTDEKLPEDEPDDMPDDDSSENELDDIVSETLSDDDWYDRSEDDEYDEYDDDEYNKDISFKRKSDSDEEKSNAGILLGIAWILFAVLCAVYVYVFFIKEPQEIPGKNNTVRLDIPEDANYRLCDIKEIDQLVSDFLTARASCNQHVLQSLVTDPSQYDDMSGLEMIFTSYAKGYQNTTCYIADGYDENGYIVIELSDLELIDIKSRPLDVMSFYIIRLEDGSYRIDNAVHSTAVETYISNVTATKDIQDIYIHVKEQNDYLLQTDSAFADLYHRIME